MAFLIPLSDDQPARLQLKINLGPVMKMGFGGKGARDANRQALSPLMNCCLHSPSTLQGRYEFVNLGVVS